MSRLDELHQAYLGVMAKAAKRAAPRKETRKVRWPGLCRHAETLGVKRTHLYLVLMGQRQSVSLMKRYKNLVASEGRV